MFKKLIILLTLVILGGCGGSHNEQIHRVGEYLCSNKGGVSFYTYVMKPRGNEYQVRCKNNEILSINDEVIIPVEFLEHLEMANKEG